MKYIKQLAIIILVCFAGEMIRYIVPLPVPGSIWGLVLMFILLVTGVVKLEKASQPIYLDDMASYKTENGILKILIENENYLPDLLRVLWIKEGRVNVSQPDRYKIEITNPTIDPKNLVVVDPSNASVDDLIKLLSLTSCIKNLSPF